MLVCKTEIILWQKEEKEKNQKDWHEWEPCWHVPKSSSGFSLSVAFKVYEARVSLQVSIPYCAPNGYLCVVREIDHPIELKCLAMNKFLQKGLFLKV